MDDLLGMQHQQQHQQKRNVINGLGMPHFNGLQSESMAQYGFDLGFTSKHVSYFYHSRVPERFVQSVERPIQPNDAATTATAASAAPLTAPVATTATVQPPPFTTTALVSCRQLQPRLRGQHVEIL